MDKYVSPNDGETCVFILFDVFVYLFYFSPVYLQTLKFKDRKETSFGGVSLHALKLKACFHHSSSVRVPLLKNCAGSWQDSDDLSLTNGSMNFVPSREEALSNHALASFWLAKLSSSSRPEFGDPR